MTVQSVLLALDLGPQSLYIAKKGAEYAQSFNASLIALHVVEPPITYMGSFSKTDDLINKNQEKAEGNLSLLCQKLNFSDLYTKVVIGNVQSQILSIAKEEKCDLIVLGSHGIGGYYHSLGSTAHFILSNAHCDIFIVQVSHLQQYIKNEPARYGDWEKLPEKLPNSSASGQHESMSTGSKKGFGENISRGPRLVNRPYKFPYKGGHRNSDEDE